MKESINLLPSIGVSCSSVVRISKKMEIIKKRIQVKMKNTLLSPVL